MTFWRQLFSRNRSKGFILALGGGGGRGLAHLGVLDVLEEHKLKPDAIVGSSIGAMFGAMYAMQPDAKAVIERAKDILASQPFSKLGLPSLEGADTQDQSWLSKLTSAAKQTLQYTRAATWASGFLEEFRN